ncbi:MAG: tRNA (adenosine(37)-N6)-threonylcarbamoyltransferase complex ATPase subunit type 1 TsaE [Bacteroidetes bacterium]|jgi:tRNA threonylcarbamoyladenosine biosynthesis protein TsaE|nr:tRNA (adenosine(37)-N6)-threonylcarbamoyltransferase complex ATPase subunit type 1 TsaE [Bacteroidota bacterium]
MSACSLPFVPATTASEAETRALGHRLAATLAPGAVVALHGDLGTGKTQLAKGVAAGLGVDPAAVSSPTFTLIHEYAGSVPVYHMDGYRTTRPEEFLALGIEEYLYGDGVCLIEWPERLGNLLPPDTLHLELTHKGGNARRIRQRGADAESSNG